MPVRHNFTDLISELEISLESSFTSQDPPVPQPAPKKKRVRNRNRYTNATGAIVTGAEIERQGSGVKADSKPASSSSTTKSVSMLHATTVSKPPTSPSAPISSSKSPTTATPTSPVTSNTKIVSKSRKKKNRVTELETTQHSPRRMLPAGTPSILNGPPTLIDQYFSRGEFKGFSYNPRNTFMHEFDRLSASMGWDESTKLRLRRYDEFLDILVSQFNLYYGVSADRLKPWQDLCQVIGIDPPPITLEDARTVRQSTSYVNKYLVIVGCLSSTRQHHRPHRVQEEWDSGNCVFQRCRASGIHEADTEDISLPSSQIYRCSQISYTINSSVDFTSCGPTNDTTVSPCSFTSGSESKSESRLGPGCLHRQVFFSVPRIFVRSIKTHYGAILRDV